MTDATATRSAAIEQLLAVGRPERAEELARDVLASDPEQPLVVCLLGRAQLAQDRAADALKSAHRAVTLAPEHPEPHRFLAVAAVANGDRATAVRAISTSVELAPNSPGGHQTRAQVLLRLGQPETALDAAREAVRLAPHHVGTAVVHAACLLANQRRDDAAAEADRALRIDPDDVAAQELRARLAVARGESDAADRARRVLGMRPSDADTRRLVVSSLQSHFRVVRMLVRLEVWIADLPPAGRWFVRLTPFLYLRVALAVHSDAALVLAAPVVLYLLLTWATGPTTMLLLMRRAETRKFLDRLQRRVALTYGVLVLLCIAAVVTAGVTGLAPLSIAALALGVWAFTIGGVSNVVSRRLRRVILAIAGVSALAAATGSGFAVAMRDSDLVGSGFAAAMLAGVVTIWIVAVGAGRPDKGVRGRR